MSTKGKAAPAKGKPARAAKATKPASASKASYSRYRTVRP